MKLVGMSGEYFREWLDDNLVPETGNQYLHHFEKFLEWLKMDTEQLYEQHKNNLRSDEPIRRLWLSKKITQYMKYMRDELGYSIENDRGDIHATGTVLVVPTAVAGFFKSVGIEDIPGSTTIPILIEEIPRATSEQLKKMIEASGSYKVKSYIVFAKDSGLRTGDITNLPIGIVGDGLTEVGELKNDISLVEAILDPDIEYFTFEWKQQKTGRMANPSIGLETFELLKEWLRYRTEKLEISTNNEDPLFCVERTRKGYTTKKGRIVKSTKTGDWMDESNMGVVFTQLRNKAGLQDTGISIHSCRKFHKTNLEAKGVPTSWVNKMQGRKGKGTGGVYTKPNSTQLLTMYKDGYDGLRLYRKEISEFERRKRQLQGMATAFFADDKENLTRMLELIANARMDAELDAIPRKMNEIITGKQQTERKNVLIIDEDKLENHLNHGWIFKVVLPSGKILIER